MTPREKLDAISECRACLEHDPEYGRANRPALWSRLDRQEADARREAGEEYERQFGLRCASEWTRKTTIPESRVWEEM